MTKQLKLYRTQRGSKRKPSTNPYGVAVGQVWHSTANDQHKIPFTVVAVDLASGTARVSAQYTWGGDDYHGPKNFVQHRSIKLDRFKPGSRGYEREGSDPVAPGVVAAPLPAAMAASEASPTGVCAPSELSPTQPASEA